MFSATGTKYQKQGNFTQKRELRYLFGDRLKIHHHTDQHEYLRKLLEADWRLAMIGICPPEFMCPVLTTSSIYWCIWRQNLQEVTRIKEVMREGPQRWHLVPYQKSKGSELPLSHALLIIMQQDILHVGQMLLTSQNSQTSHPPNYKKFLSL